jgi:hypothetical protein
MELVDLVPSVQRAVAPPGEFDTYFPNSTSGDIEGVLADAVAEAHLDGFLADIVLDVDASTVTPDLSSAQQALVILYAMARVLTARVSNLKNRTRYKAGSAEAETEQSASVLVELLRQTQDRKKQLLDDAKAGNLATAFAMVDMYVAKSIDFSSPDVSYLYPGVL